MSTLLTDLFSTGALTVSPEDRPFWYTSGTFGPYYINTHYLVGGREAADALLLRIEAACRDPGGFASDVLPFLQSQYRSEPVFRRVTDTLRTRLGDMDRSAPFRFVSGGERRDFFFSLLPAVQMERPHAVILKDGTVLLLRPGEGNPEPVLPGESSALSGQAGIHVADLVTEASSYLRTWIPALSARGAILDRTLAVVDRRQGGEAALRRRGVSLVSLAQVDEALFDQAEASGLIRSGQRAMIRRFTEDPAAFMRQFLEEHPGYLDTLMAEGGKTAERVRLFLSTRPDRDARPATP